MSSEFYSEPVLNASYNELKKFLKWMNEKKGIFPTIIGGWAVWSYEQDMYSRDIDVVMPDSDSIKQLLHKEFFPANDYSPVTLGFKIIKHRKTVGGPDGPTIEFEVMDGSKERVDYQNLGIKVQWGWALEHRELRTIEGLNLYAPKRELLIIFKTIAAIDRSKAYLNNGDFRLPSKIWKDCHDVAVLSIGKSLDKDFIKKYLTEANAIQYVNDFILKYKDPEYSAILTKFGGNYNEIEKIFEF